MVFKIIVSAMIMIGTWLLNSWLYIYSQAVKAELMVKQLEDSNLTSATVRWVTGDTLSVFVYLAAICIIGLMWKKELTKLTKKGIKK